MLRKHEVALLITIILSMTALITLFLLPTYILADATNTTVIQVNISEVAQISVSPSAISWTQIPPGNNGSVQRITVRNTGSTTFSNGIFASVDSFGNTTSNPTAGDDPRKYMAGSFLTISNTTDLTNDKYWFVNQMSWNETNYPNPSSPTSGATMWGYYNNKTNSWLWEFKPATGETSCRNGTGGAGLKIIATAGSEDISTATAATFITNNSAWGTWNITNGPLQEYCIAVHTSCNYLMIYKFDMNSSLPNCWNRGYIAPSSFSPGIEKYFDVHPNVPNGVPAGTVTNSTVTFTAS